MGDRRVKSVGAFHVCQHYFAIPRIGVAIHTALTHEEEKKKIQIRASSSGGSSLRVPRITLTDLKYFCAV